MDDWAGRDRGAETRMFNTRNTCAHTRNTCGHLGNCRCIHTTSINYAKGMVMFLVACLASVFAYSRKGNMSFCVFPL